MFRSLADVAYRRSWYVVALAAVFMAVAGAFGGPVAGLLRGGGFDDPHSGSVKALNQIEQASGVNPYQGIVALIRTGQSVQSATTRGETDRVVAIVKAEPGIGRVVTFYTTHSAAMVSRDGKATYVVGEFKAISNTAIDAALTRLTDKLSRDPYVTLGGGGVAGTQVGTTVSKDLGRAELLAFPILFVLLLLVFRGFLAAFFPLMVGAITVLSGYLGLRIVNEFHWLSIYAVNLVTGLGLGLSIDYSLLILSRYREELAKVGPGQEALRRTLSTAGRTVLFSSLTVAGALASLLLFPQRFLFSMGLGGVLVTLSGAVVALTVLPAILGLLGTRVNWGAPKRWQHADRGPEGSSWWYRMSHSVMQHAAVVAGVTAVVLILMGIPFLRIKLTSVDASVLPKTLSARQVNDALQTQFPANRTSPLILAIQAPANGASTRLVRTYETKLKSLPNIAGIFPAHIVGANTWEIDVTSKGSVYSDQSQKLVRDIRSLRGPYPVQVGGDTAGFVDLKSSLTSHLPYALLIVALVTLVMLFLATGSVILPLKTVVMSLLTLSATYGLLVLVFQDGRLQGVLHYASQQALEATQLIVLFAVAFGLSTDYAVFLLSRIKEVHDSGRDNAESVAIGLERTGPIVTSAALLFCIAIGAFTTSQIVFIKELGLGTALAVIIDATIVRALLVPSLMKLLGQRNWWAPGPLRALQRRLAIEPTT